ncbi:MAG: PSP1 domain-containing protein, partial [Rikenellaceae bacterium]
MSDCKINIERGCKFCSGDCSSEDNIGAKSCPGCDKLASFDWLSEYGTQQNDIFEIRFKNTRKGYFTNANNLDLKKGDIVAVEASPGHDIGIVSLTGDMVSLQMKKTGFRSEGIEFKKIYRKAKPYDIEKWQEAIALEQQTMIETRNIANNLGLNMKIGDVEYQGDRLKAIFYYIADERVDFRELIKILADQFKIRVEMKQIGARQEAGRIGGI